MKPRPPFPIEAILPGIHAVRPEIASMEGAQFLQFGPKAGGFDLSDPVVRAYLLCRKPFVDFQVSPLPAAIVARLAALPDDWDQRTEFEAEASAIERSVDEHYALPEHLGAMIVEEKEVWISPR